jgi:hypothetical protein
MTLPPSTQTVPITTKVCSSYSYMVQVKSQEQREKWMEQKLVQLEEEF